ncbi:microprocessor complex subunit DGCR8-like [Macrosteles quadrilineatus]|uniref:microprocessor complex subunit DGCR8-like n=1 Tax=Macrosteles quadrilineatus TaxID=74068 RepID=UPI0023E2DBCF|nr:microprocessor complex subunit DGCR8-like [Macrosteles quadrilineatus]
MSDHRSSPPRKKLHYSPCPERKLDSSNGEGNSEYRKSNNLSDGSFPDLHPHSRRSSEKTFQRSGSSPSPRPSSSSRRSASVPKSAIRDKIEEICDKEKSKELSKPSSEEGYSYTSDENNDSESHKSFEKHCSNSSDGTTGCDYKNTDGNLNENRELDLSDENVIEMFPNLQEFDILDDLEESEQEDEACPQSHSESSDYETVEEDEGPTIDDVDAMLEEGLPEKFKDTGRKEPKVRLKRKVQLEEIAHNHFDLLPEGWIKIVHSSGMPVYLEQKTRVCTMTRPYYLGPGSTRNHKIPLSAIPCLQYRRALEEEKKIKEEKEAHLKVEEENKQKEEKGDKENNIEQTQNKPQEIQLFTAKIETSEENEAKQSLEALDLREYCKNLFIFKTTTTMPFKSWADRRKYARMTKDLKKRQRPTLPGGTKLLKFPTQNMDGTNSRSKGEWIINPNGKSYVCILHEYVQHALKKHPKYQFKELQNPATPYSATVFIDDMQYSVGVGASKKQAKVEAAKAALEVLIPEMKDKIERDGQFGMRSGIAQRSQSNDVSIFDEIRVEDPRVAEFCAKTTEPPPYAILLTCLSRNLGLGEVKSHYEMNSKKHKEDEYTMTVGEHKATVVCKNKRDGKQRAAQAILQLLHPNIKHWGSLLRMYGNKSIKSVKEKKQEEQEITRLQSKASLNQPNFAILEKLRSEMLKLKEKKDAMKAKGKFTPPENVVLPSLSSADLNKINISSSTSTDR